MLDEKIKDDEGLLERHEGEWVNLYFTKAGKSGAGREAHNTERAAHEAFVKQRERLLAKFEKTGRRQVYVFSDFRCPVQDVSHAIPIPVKGE